MKGIARLGIKISVSTFIAISLAFISVDSLSGDSSVVLASTMGDVEAFRKHLALDAPFLDRFYTWIVSIYSGDLGTSLVYGDSVLHVVLQRVKVTFPLAILAFCLSTVFGVCVGVASVLRPSRFFSVVVSLLLSIPVVWLGLALIYIFSIKFHFFPSGGNDTFASYILPSLTLGIVQGAMMARYVKVALLGVKDKDFIHFAQIRGISKTYALCKHGLSAVCGTLLAVLGVQFGFLMTGVVVVERVFSMPGLGDLLYESILMRDIPVASATIGFLVLIIIFINTVADILAYILTPALRKGYNA